MSTLNIEFINDIKTLITESKRRVAVAVNSELTMLYWKVGKLVSLEILKGNRAEYGKELIPDLSKQLTISFGKGWSKRNLSLMVKLYEVYPDKNILQTLSAKLSWSHFINLIYIENSIKREFYISITIEERWSTRIMVERIDSQLFERTAISRKPELTIIKELELLKEKGEVSSDMLLKDPYILDFLELNDSYLEKDLEDAILRELQKFLLEMGSGFTFIDRQYRIQVDDDNFYIDLLFYNRKLKRLVAIDLKIGNFKAEYKGQMELYLRWLAKYEKEKDENLPLGIILCTGKKNEQIELLELDKSGIHVAEYLTNMPSKEILETKLHQAVINAKQLLESRVGGD
ncbi:MAG: PDDEXK nuclease domain-containing protein [Spirochaetia bacterium]|jgi:predicted nuclease of restriction endonuclease-like (RecB) superfamily|nr:PDDEXK nuclease domain-containing protein [Spirochaetia bacterium]